MSILTDGTLADRLVSRLIASGLPYPLVVRRTVTDDDPFNPGTHTEDHTASGWLDQYAAQDVDGSLIRTTDVKAFVVCASVDITPATTDKLVANGKTYTIVNVGRDPANAAYVIQARV